MSLLHPRGRRALLIATCLGLAGTVSAQIPTFGERHRIRPHSAPDLPLQQPPAIPFKTLAGDFDGDGDLDLIVRDELFRNDPSGFPSVQRLPELTSSEVWAAGDIDGDGDADLVFDDGRSPVVLVADGTPFTLDATRLTPFRLLPTDSIALGDIDGDGDLDLFFSDSGAHRFYRNDGLGFFTEIASLFRFDPSVDAGFTDLDGDGDLDLVELGVVELQVFANDGTGGFTDVSSAWRPLLDFDWTDLALGDFDADGDPDAVLLNFFGWRHRLLINSSPNGPFVKRLLPSLDGRAREAVAGDFDGDGDEEFLVATDTTLHLFEHQGGLVFADVARARLDLFGPNLHGMLVGDLEGDGDLDLILGGSIPLLGDGSGRLRLAGDALPAWAGVGTPHGAVIGDLDGDGEFDLVVDGDPDPLGAYPRILLGDGTGQFRPSPEDLGLLSGATHWALGDLDGDQDLDLVVGRAFSQPTVRDLAYFNDGTGHFTPTEIPGSDAQTRAVALGDVDGDGDLDLVGARTLQPPRLHTNDGTGSFTVSGFFIGNRAQGVELADLDGDGDLDAYFATLSQDRLFLNDGAGAFTDATSTLPVEDVDHRTVRSADVDGDGDLDLIAAEPRQLALYLNGGNADFTNASQQLPPHQTPPGLEQEINTIGLADVEGDGDLDLMIHDLLFLGDGAGNFSLATVPVEGKTVLGVNPTLVDLDRDGDVDFLMQAGVEDRTSLAFNLTRQVSWITPARLGRELELRVDGPPGGTYLLLGSTRRGSLTTPFGAWQLDRTGVIASVSGRLDASGRATFRRRVGVNPALIDVDFFWQAAVGFPRRLTNLERTTVRGY